MYKGRKCTESNPWQSNGLEWSTPVVPGHGNWEGDIPEVHRWPYDYNHPDEKADFTPQWKAPAKVSAGKG
jgi:cytochrome c oxidase subunit 1